MIEVGVVGISSSFTLTLMNRRTRHCSYLNLRSVTECILSALLM
jgi:hypothetical protein